MIGVIIAMTGIIFYVFKFFAMRYIDKKRYKYELGVEYDRVTSALCKFANSWMRLSPSRMYAESQILFPMFEADKGEEAGETCV